MPFLMLAGKGAGVRHGTSIPTVRLRHDAARTACSRRIHAKDPTPRRRGTGYGQSTGRHAAAALDRKQRKPFLYLGRWRWPEPPFRGDDASRTGAVEEGARATERDGRYSIQPERGQPCSDVDHRIGMRCPIPCGCSPITCATERPLVSGRARSTLAWPATAIPCR